MAVRKIPPIPRKVDGTRLGNNRPNPVIITKGTKKNIILT
jgi:hypothetical protein